MSLATYAAAGYAPVPLRGGHPAVPGILANRAWRHTPGADESFAGCETGVVCASRPLSGASGPATLAAVASTWVAGIRWETTDRKLSADLAAIVERIAGRSPTRIDDAEVLRVFKVEAPFDSRRLPPMHFPHERYTALSYRPHRFELLCRASWLVVSGGTWKHGALPDVRRNELPTLTPAQADQIVSDVGTIFSNRGALPWM